MTNWITRFGRSEEGQRLLEQERVLLETTERIWNLMDEQDVSQIELADRLGTSQANVSKLLHGSQNFTLRTLSDIYFKLGRSVHVYDAPVGDSIHVPDGYITVNYGTSYSQPRLVYSDQFLTTWMQSMNDAIDVEGEAAEPQYRLLAA